jgi:hypothetical protein
MKAFIELPEEIDSRRRRGLVGKTIRLRDKEHCNLYRHSRASWVAAPRPSPIIFALRNRARSGGKSATNTPFPSAASVIASCIATATMSHGGPGSMSIQLRSRSSCGVERDRTKWCRL